MDIKNIFKQLKCFITSCNKTYKAVQIKTVLWNKQKSIVIKKFVEKSENGESMKKEDFIKEMEKIDNAYFKSKIYNDFANCVILNCYECVEKNLDYLLSQMKEVKYKKPSKYLSTDYVNIMMLYHSINTIIKIANNPEVGKNMIMKK
jgi:hypothetical protein